MTTAAGRRVLLVEDDRALRELLLLTFGDEGYEARAAESGQAALELLREWHPRLVVLDLMMSDMDGWTFRARQLANEALGDIPVIVLSAVSNLESRLDGMQVAATIEKPFNLDTLLDTAASLVEGPR